MATLNWLGLSAYYNRLDIVTTDDPYNREHVLAVAGWPAIASFSRRVIQSRAASWCRGYSSDPGQHWAQNQINGLLLVLQVMGILAIFLSGGLVVNISAILTQQIKQIGIMRAVGAASSIDWHVLKQRADLERHRLADRFAVWAIGCDRIG
ncbi:MAG: hypothetical protein U0559_18695 [Anaerolineae bacterium]